MRREVVHSFHRHHNAFAVTPIASQLRYSGTTRPCILIRTVLVGTRHGVPVDSKVVALREEIDRLTIFTQLVCPADDDCKEF